MRAELPWEKASDESRRYKSWRDGLARGRPWDKVGARALGLLRRLLEAEPRKRLTLEQLLRHTWTVEDADQVDSKLTGEYGLKQTTRKIMNKEIYILDLSFFLFWITGYPVFHDSPFLKDVYIPTITIFTFCCMARGMPAVYKCVCMILNTKL